MADATDNDGLRAGPRLTIPRDELEVRATRSGGAGGQHVNTSSTRVEVRWRPAGSRALSEADRNWLLERLASRLDAAGWLRVVASDTRSQRQNRDLAEGRLAETVRRALLRPKVRRKTKPSAASRERRLTEKKQRGERKQRRRDTNWE
ncbi:MAG TPA: alternative ribosome rescue aminoacyl-tRNA hydrolase ArfB [Gemmatimonadaceae bacterium]|nr:alternative ribosome rescue aminoacyl-tRNA hydrolase ArfB [Gemmatimonadaceae bacterium]